MHGNGRKLLEDIKKHGMNWKWRSNSDGMMEDIGVFSFVVPYKMGTLL
jgi:hypothetical protein